MIDVEGSDGGNSRDWVGYALAAVALLVLLGLGSGTARDGADLTSGDIFLKYELLQRSERRLPGRERNWLAMARAEYQAAARAVPSPAVLRRLGVVNAELNRPAMPEFNRLVSPAIIEDLSSRQVDALRREHAMWRDIYGVVSVAPGDVAEYEARIGELDLGPAWTMALRQLHVAAGQPETGMAVARRAESRAAQQLIWASLVILVWILLFVVGALLLIKVIGNRREYLEKLTSSPEAQMPSPRTLWSSFLTFLVLFVALQLVGSMLAAGRDLTFQVVMIFGSYVLAGLLAWLWLAARSEREGSDLTAIGLTTRDLGRNLLIGLGGYAAILPAVAVALAITQLVGRLLPDLPSPTHPAGPLIGQVADKPVVVLLFFLVAVMAPVFEEIFFRGVLYNALRVRFSVIASILLSGAAFAAVHPQLPLGFLPLFVLGAGFAALLAVTRSLVPAIVAHSINNTITFFIALFMFAR